jgi:hypothetical protein
MNRWLDPIHAHLYVQSMQGTMQEIWSSRVTSWQIYSLHIAQVSGWPTHTSYPSIREHREPENLHLFALVSFGERAFTAPSSTAAHAWPYT